MAEGSKFSLATNLRLMWDLLFVFPRATRAIFVFVLGINFVGLSLVSLGWLPAYESGWRPSAFEVLLQVVAIVPWLILFKLVYMLGTYRGRTRTYYPGSFFVSAMCLSGLFLLPLPAAFWMLTRAAGYKYQIEPILILMGVGFPFFTLFFWFLLLSRGNSEDTWP